MVFQDNTVQIPPELDEGYMGGGYEQGALEWWQNTDPYAAYQAQLMDYLIQQGEYDAETIWGYIKQIPLMKAMGFSVPLIHATFFSKAKRPVPFEKVQQAEGERVNVGLNAFREKQTALRDVITQGVYSKEGRRKLARYVAQGKISEDYAYKINPDWQAYLAEEQEKLAKQQEKERIAREDLLQFGAYSTQGRMDLVKAVREGTITQQEAFGSGSQWEKWQRGGGGSNLSLSQQIELANRMPLGGYESPPGKPSLTSEGLTKAPSGVILGPGERTINPATGEAFTVGGEIGAAGRGGLSASVPWAIEGWEAYSKKLAEGEMRMFRAGKLNPLGENTPETKAHDLQMWQQYGDVYGAYRTYLANMKTMNDYKDIDQWIRENPNPQIQEYIRKSARQPSAPMAITRY